MNVVRQCRSDKVMWKQQTYNVESCNLEQSDLKTPSAWKTNIIRLRNASDSLVSGIKHIIRSNFSLGRK